MAAVINLTNDLALLRSIRKNLKKGFGKSNLQFYITGIESLESFYCKNFNVHSLQILHFYKVLRAIGLNIATTNYAIASCKLSFLTMQCSAKRFISESY